MEAVLAVGLDRDRESAVPAAAFDALANEGLHMLDTWLQPRATSTADPAPTDALVRAVASLARLDQAAATHPLRPALLYRPRLEAVRRQGAADGQAIGPWHLAAVAAQPGTPPLLAAAAGFRQWIGGGGARPPLRAALVRFWVRQRVLRLSFPLTGARALHADAPWAEHD